MRLERTLERLYRRLLALYPRRFRNLFEEEMVEFFRDGMRDAASRGGRRAVVLAFAKASVDAIGCAGLERWEARKSTKTPRRPKGERRMFDGLSSDLKSAFRSIAAQPGLAAAGAGTLGLGLAAATLVFAVVDSVLLRPLPFSDPERLVTIWNRYDASLTSSSPPDYVDRKNASRLLSGLAAIATGSMNLSGDFEPRNVEVARVTASFFDVLGAALPIGPARFPAELGSGDDALVVLGFGLWKSAFGSDPDVVGRSVRLNGERYEIVGVAPEGLDFPRGTDLYVPLVFRPEQLADDFRGNEYLTTIARLSPDASLEALSAEMEVIAASVLTRVPDRRGFLERNGWGARVVPLTEHLTANVRPALLVLSVAVVFVVLVAGFNVAGILVASAASRGRDLALRSALGARRSRIMRQLLVESLVLSSLGAVVGTMLSWAFVRSLPLWVPRDVPRLDNVALDGRAIAFVAILALVSGIASGVAPTWQLSAGRLRPLLTLGRSPQRSSRLRNALVVAEVGFAFLLSIGAGLLVRSFERITSVDPGFEPESRLSMQLTLPTSSHPEPRQRIDLANLILERVRALPGVVAVTASERLPLDGSNWTATFYPEGHLIGPGEPTPGAELNVVGPEYGKTLGIPLLAGREFDATDNLDSPRVILVDETTAERFWPEGAVGKRVSFNRPDRNADFREIVGVVGHVKMGSLEEKERFQIYFPMAQARWNRLSVTLLVEGDEGAYVAGARREIASIAPEIPFYAVRTLDDAVSESLAFREFQLALLGGFATLAVVLAAVGLFGLLSYSVSRRTGEIGIRMALGARTGSVFGLVLREGAVLVGVGLGLGLLMALALSRFLASLLFGIAPTDALTFLTVSGALLAVSAAAAWIPARRAAALDPVEALRVG